MSCLLIIDVQNDFMQGGSLQVSDSMDILKPINTLRKQHNNLFDLIVLSQDWHPFNHMSFASNHANKKVFDTINLNGSNQILWPNHCVQESFGSEIHKGLHREKSDIIIKKGTNPTIDSYSAFMDNDKKHKTELESILKKNNITTVYICGLATDYCVYYSCLDAASLGFKTYFLQDASKGVSKDTTAKAIENMIKYNIKHLKLTLIFCFWLEPILINREYSTTSTPFLYPIENKPFQKWIDLFNKETKHVEDKLDKAIDDLNSVTDREIRP
ncbi:hypothetical protein CYY_004810 [Polysphondylium violaceum]|uniref:nicotinamidase n=1 Tax=Polysphondylium violaceum TaxID=133409 RepID=A0A8J4Q4P8_9MYCE|nr:hypothetical protein CYY_004810 [Polysphondylium violaceum]